MKAERAACYCGNISAEIMLSKPVESFEPRACDCDFCEKHGAAYISDPEGDLTIRLNDTKQVASYQHGSGLAEFLICTNCGVLLAVICTRDGRTVGSLNSKTLDNRKLLKPAQSASPKSLSDAKKLERWGQVWFQDVSIKS